MTAIFVWSLPIVPNIAAAHTAVNWLPGVHVCSVEHYDAHNVSCFADDARLNLQAYGGGWFSASALGGASFTSNTLTLIVRRHTANGDYELGRTDLKSGLQYGLIAGQLASTFQEMGIWPVVGTTYNLEVDETDGATQVLLG